MNFSCPVPLFTTWIEKESPKKALNAVEKAVM